MRPAVQGSPSNENQILTGLSKSDYQHFFSQLELVSLAQGEVIYEAHGPLDYVYFPVTAVFSMLVTMEDGNTVEVGPVGREGLVGLRVFLGAETTPERVIVHIAGNAMRLRARELKAEMGGRTVLPGKLLRYTQMLLAMTAQTGACNKLHSLEQQLARWLLTMDDYVNGDLRITHELIALTLGVRRAGISVAANSFRTEGLIDYHRSDIRIVDRNRLQAVACECYPVVKEHYDNLYADLSAGTSN